jgi:hypothetical protein
VQCDGFLEKRKRKGMLPEDDPVRLKQVVNAF